MLGRKNSLFSALRLSSHYVLSGGPQCCALLSYKGIESTLAAFKAKYCEEKYMFKKECTNVYIFFIFFSEIILNQTNGSKNKDEVSF